MFDLWSSLKNFCFWNPERSMDLRICMSYQGQQFKTVDKCSLKFENLPHGFLNLKSLLFYYGLVHINLRIERLASYCF